MIKQSDLAYLAGLLDGEGCFRVTVQRRPKRNRFQLMPQITVGIQSAELVVWLKDEFGGLTYNRHSGGMHQWRLAKFADLVNLLPQVLPLLKVKYANAQALLTFVQYRLEQEKQSGRYNAPYDDHCFELADKVRALNGNKGRILV